MRMKVYDKKWQSEGGEFMKWHVHWRGGPDRTGVGLAVKLARPVGAGTRQGRGKGEADSLELTDSIWGH